VAQVAAHCVAAHLRLGIGNRADAAYDCVCVLLWPDARSAEPAAPALQATVGMARHVLLPGGLLLLDSGQGGTAQASLTIGGAREGPTAWEQLFPTRHGWQPAAAGGTAAASAGASAASSGEAPTRRFLGVRRAALPLNTWQRGEAVHHIPVGPAGQPALGELDRLQGVVVARSAAERRAGGLSEASFRKAVRTLQQHEVFGGGTVRATAQRLSAAGTPTATQYHRRFLQVGALQQHGLCILRALFSAEAVAAQGGVACAAAAAAVAGGGPPSGAGREEEAAAAAASARERFHVNVDKFTIRCPALAQPQPQLPLTHPAIVAILEAAALEPAPQAVNHGVGGASQARLVRSALRRSEALLQVSQNG
jgi:hypothetical protein